MATTPRPGRPVRGSRSGQPFSVLLDLLGRRWTLTVLWALSEGPRSFGELKGADERMSNGTLSARLRELRASGLVEKHEGGAYALSHLGRELVAIGTPLADWSKRWAAELES